MKRHNPFLCATHRDYNISFAGGQIMKKLALLILILGIPSVAVGEVSIRVCLADGNTPFLPIEPNSHVYPDIMVGTWLTFIVDSNVAEYWWGGLVTEDANMDYGLLSGRDYNDITNDWEGSRFPAAGTRARVYTLEEPGVYGFQLLGHNSAVEGDWFIIDYNAINVGDCNVRLYEYYMNQDELITELIAILVFHHVPTRDIIKDTVVDFKDFAILASYWQETNCNDLNWCEGADFNTDRNIDLYDLKMFADFWLEKTQ
jgi:hypothetical protein